MENYYRSISPRLQKAKAKKTFLPQHATPRVSGPKITVGSGILAHGQFLHLTNLALIALWKC